MRSIEKDIIRIDITTKHNDLLVILCWAGIDCALDWDEGWGVGCDKFCGGGGRGPLKIIIDIFELSKLIQSVFFKIHLSFIS
jgi:hypothetical protein